MKKTEVNNWMVLYTRSRWEKKVDQLLKDSNIISYCPLIKKSKKWVDRSKIIEIPLFNSYLFVFAPHSALSKILQTSGVVTYITFCGKPAILNNAEIDSIKDVVNKYSDIETMSLSDLKSGDSATITEGPFNAKEGQIQQVNGKSVVMVIESMNCALTVKIDRKQLSPAGDALLN